MQFRLLHVSFKVILHTSSDALEEVSCFPAPLRCLNEERKLQENAAGDSTLFLLPRTGTRAKDTRELIENQIRIAAAELTNSAFNRYNCFGLKYGEPVAPSSRSVEFESKGM